MSTEEIDYEAVLADLHERRNKIDAAIDAVKGILAAVGRTPSGSTRIRSAQDIAPDTFFGLTIADAAIKYLGMVRSAQTLPQIWEALKQGGLPHTKYNAVYTAFSRREQVGDVIKLPDGSFGLAEWYPTNPTTKRQAKQNSKPQETTAEKESSAKNNKSPIAREQVRMTQPDHCVVFLREAKKPLHITALLSKLAEKGIVTKAVNLSTPLRVDTQKRFENLGDNVWALTEWSESIKAPHRKDKEATLPI
jgi:DNA-directed RNA polymerase delta subunit